MSRRGFIKSNFNRVEVFCVSDIQSRFNKKPSDMKILNHAGNWMVRVFVDEMRRNGLTMAMVSFTRAKKAEAIDQGCADTYGTHDPSARLAGCNGAIGMGLKCYVGLYGLYSQRPPTPYSSQELNMMLPAPVSGSEMEVYMRWRYTWGGGVHEMEVYSGESSILAKGASGFSADPYGRVRFPWLSRPPYKTLGLYWSRALAVAW